jgi:periplasmic divalent cation tolerance protein
LPLRGRKRNELLPERASAYACRVQSSEPREVPDAESTQPRVVLVTAPDMRTAEELARELVGRSALACANLIEGVKSIYRWRGRVEESSEVLMIGKTTQARAADVERILGELHPYDVPECVFLAPERVEEKYLAWLIDETEPGARADG